MDERKTLKNQKHTIVMDERQKLCITGVLDVLNFDEEMIVMETTMGMLSIEGEDLHISKLDLVSGELSVDGEIQTIAYNDKEQNSKKGGSFFSKMFK